MYLVYMRLHFPQNGIVSIGDQFCHRCDSGIVLCHARRCSDCYWADAVPGVELSTSSHIDPVEERQIWRLGWVWSGTMVFNATFNNILVYCGGQFYSWRKQEYPEKSTELPQVTENCYQIMLYEYTSPWTGFELTIVLMRGTDCKSNCKSN